MKIKQKINAFTIAEMLVVLVISAIVISLALLVLNLVQKQIGLLQKNGANANEIILLERVLWNDMHTQNMTFHQKEDVLIAFNTTDTIRYEFKEQYVLRNKDTLKVGILSKEFYLEGEKINENDVDAIELTLTETHQNKKLFIFTQKDASYYMNLE